MNCLFSFSHNLAIKLYCIQNIERHKNTKGLIFKGTFGIKDQTISLSECIAKVSGGKYWSKLILEDMEGYGGYGYYCIHATDEKRNVLVFM